MPIAERMICFTFSAFVSPLFFGNQYTMTNPASWFLLKQPVFTTSPFPTGVAAIQKLGSENNFLVDSTRDAAYFVEDSLEKYSAVVFLSTTLNVLNADQQVAFERYIQAGGGFAGIHAAADTEYDWPWYNKLVGAQFAFASAAAKSCDRRAGYNPCRHFVFTAPLGAF
jgi:hypothetical protein